MKILFALLSVLLLTAVTANAQQKRDTIHHAAAQKKPKMATELKLTKQQAASVKASNKEYKTEKQKVKNDTKLTAAQKKTKIKELKKDKKAKVDATLTPEQKEKKKELKEEKKKEQKAKKAAKE